MKNRSAKALVAALTGAGALVGVGAAIVWRLAVPGATEPAQLTSVSDHSSGYSGFGIQIAHVRPDWFPSSLYFIGGGILIGLILSSFLLDVGMRFRTDRHHAKTGLFALLIVFGGSLGAGAAAAWTQWPPTPPDPLADVDVSAMVETHNNSATWTRTQSLQVVVMGQDASVVTERPIVAPMDTTADGSPFRPEINRPWLVFPVGGALIAGALALSLSIRDVRLTGHRHE